MYSLFSFPYDFILISEYAADSFFGAGHACWHTHISKVVYPIFSILVVYLTMLACHQCNAYWNIASVQLCTHLNEGWRGTFSDETVTLFCLFRWPYPFLDLSSSGAPLWYCHRPPHFILHSLSSGKPYSNLNLVQVPWRGHRSYPLLLSVLVDCQGEAHLFPTDVSTCLC